MIVVTGAAGFIGSCMVSKLNSEGIDNLILVDDFSRIDKENNLLGKKFIEKVDRSNFFEWVQGQEPKIEIIIHLGARTDTTEPDCRIFDALNLNYSKQMWILCQNHQIPLLYASSAATYGLGELAYNDRHEIIPNLKPLNPYGVSKNDFDKWVLEQTSSPPFWAGFKFFNVYGPNEYHKGRMASVIMHAYNQLKEKHYINLFRSHHPDYKDGGQIRDFIYVKDVCMVLFWFMKDQPASGIYNLGTGHPETFETLASCTINASGIDGDIRYIDTPIDIRDKYQYYTCANMDKLRQVGYTFKFYSLQEGTEDYVKNYLLLEKYL